jgi:Heparinase II/III-like protein/Heparinase II/III N-terminus
LCSTMDVAIRLVNWIWAYHFFARSPEFDEEKKVVFLKSVVSHTQFVTENLEYYGEFSDNHYVSNIVGLAIVGITFPQFKQAEKWKQTGLQCLFGEVVSQVHEDGVQFEGSISYHRLVLEMFVSALILCEKNGIEVPQAVWSRLEKMFEFVLHYTKPDGTAPQIGDTDNGRLHVLGKTELMDHRYLLAIGAVLFERADFKAVAGTFHEEAFWLLGEEGLKRFDAVKDEAAGLPSKAFSRGGFYFMRNDQLYMAVRCAPNGRRGIGNHSHNDALSFELYAYGKSFIVDPGTYVYTPEPDWRNLFRSTAYHNTVLVDGEEINRIPDDLFRLMNDATPVVNRWETTDKTDFLDAQHNGYERLRDPVTHRRQFYFDKVDNYWIIRDVITGKGEHALSWYFHFDAGIDLAVRNQLTVETLCQGGANLVLLAVDAPPLSLELEEGWISASYGLKEKGRVARYSCTVELPTSVVFILYPHVSMRRLSEFRAR